MRETNHSKSQAFPDMLNLRYLNSKALVSKMWFPYPAACLGCTSPSAAGTA